MYIYLVRHGESETTCRAGWGNNHLTAKGFQQANELSISILNKKSELKISKIYSSDLQRSIETATPTANKLRLNIILSSEFRAPDNGILANMLSEEADVKFPNLHYYTLEYDETYPGGESPHSFFDRISRDWEKFVEKVLMDGNNVILFTHSSVIRVIYCLVEKLKYSNKDKGKIPEAEILTIEMSVIGVAKCLFKL